LIITGNFLANTQLSVQHDSRLKLDSIFFTAKIWTIKLQKEIMICDYVPLVFLADITNRSQYHVTLDMGF
jgi:hypothetical protein